MQAEKGKYGKIYQGAKYPKIDHEDWPYLIVCPDMETARKLLSEKLNITPDGKGSRLNVPWDLNKLTTEDCDLMWKEIHDRYPNS